jgi:carboxypeptidase C (cathepsin A)
MEGNGGMKVIRLGLVLALLFTIPAILLLHYGGPLAEERGPKEEKKRETLEEEKFSKTTHTITVNEKTLIYTAVAGQLLIEQEEHDAKGRLFYVAYTLQDPERSQRPITFAFNGGPGAASVWLHLGGLGPKRIHLRDDGKALPPPVRYRENPYTWLTFTDLVFVDPIGTGFSRSKPDDEKTNKKFYGVQQDIESVAEFIRLYLARNNRWMSPKFLVGESYGTTRVSGLTWYLHQRYGIDLNGVVLVSPVLDFDTILFHPSNDLPYLLFFPTYAAAAWHHKVLSETLKRGKLKDLLEGVEHFCLHTYVAALAKGEDLDEDEKKELVEKISAYTGLAAELIERHNFRINWMEFTRNLLKKDGLLVGRMDSTITGVEPDPTRPWPIYDPSLDTLYGPFSSAMNAYVRKELKFESDLVYEFLNMKVNKLWDWSSGLEMNQGFIDVSHTLRDALAVNENLKVLIASGLFDLATPYFAAKYTVSHMWLGEQRSNITIEHYEAGHMIYTHTDALRKLSLDARCFYASALKE